MGAGMDMNSNKSIFLAIACWGLIYGLAVALFPLISVQSHILTFLFSLFSAILCVALSGLCVVSAVREFTGKKMLLFIIPCMVIVYVANGRIIEPVAEARTVLMKLEEKSNSADMFTDALKSEVNRRPAWKSWEMRENLKLERLIVNREGTVAVLLSPLSAESREKFYSLPSEVQEKRFPGVELTLETGRNGVLIMIIDMFLLAVAVMLGGWLCSVVEKVSYIIPLSIIAGVADLWSVFFGATEEMVKDMETARYFLLSFPILGKPDIVPMIGVTDFVFFGLYIQMARKFGLPVKKNILSLLAVFFVVLLLAIILKAGIPVLPFMAVGFLIINIKQLPFEKEDRKNTLIMVIFLTILFSFITYMKRR